MHHAKRVIYDNKPYLVRIEAAGEKVYGPFAPGAEPTLAMATADREVNDPQLIARISELLEASPPLPFDAEKQSGAPFS